MLSNVPVAKFYSLSSIESPAAPLSVGGIQDLDYVADLLHDEQVILNVGVSNEECVIVLNLKWEEIADIIDTARKNKNEDTKSND